jgi:hypothetical protein
MSDKRKPYQDKCTTASACRHGSAIYPRGVVYCAADFGLGGQEGGGRIIRPIIFAFCCAVPAWRIVQIAHDLHKKAQFCTFGRDLSSICNAIKHDWRRLLGDSKRHPRHELALQKVQIARSTFAHFGKLHSICPNAFPSP